MTVTAKDILGVVMSVTKQWTRQRKAEERGRSRSMREHLTKDVKVTFTEVAHEILPTAYDHASGGGSLPASKRQIYYACREEFRRRTGRPLTEKRFSTLLTQYMNRRPAETSLWKVTADARGTLTIPNAGRPVRIPCGTTDIANYLWESGCAVDPLDINAGLGTEWPSLAAGQRYQAVMYIEKEGFEPLLREARIAERFDLAILSCKGQSVVAARKYVDKVCRVDGGVPLFVVHDFDKAGFEISQRLTTVSSEARANDTVVYEFENEINATDLGLHLDDVEQYSLGHEEVEFKGKFADDSICTDEEKAYLLSGRRVELNAFTSPQFVEWLEAKLTENDLTERLIPDDQDGASRKSTYG